MSGALKSHTGVPAKDRARLFDMHVHTTGSADSSIPPWMAVSRARELGLRGLAITDHDRLTVLEPAPLDLVLVPGAELSTDWGDLLALGISELPDVHLPVPEIVDSIHAQGGVAVVPHPFADIPYAMNERVYDIIDIVDGLEVTSPRRSADNRLARKVAHDHHKAILGGSDAHALGEMGRGLTACDVSDLKGLLDAIRSATTSAVMGR
jgi:hypothetical protein